MKRVNLLNYFHLAETLQSAKQTMTPDVVKGGHMYFSAMDVRSKIESFIADDNGFYTCKHAAGDLLETAKTWLEKVTPEGKFISENFDKDHQSWEFSDFVRRIDSFKNVFDAECREVDVYSVGQIGIYKTSALVSDGASVIPIEVRAHMSQVAVDEFRNAGKCLAFDLPSACGFHALRGMELVMDDYLRSFQVVTDTFKTWNDYIQAAEKLIRDGNESGKKPSPRVTAMLDRMRTLDRNPLMHPRDTLDEVAADQLFKLSAVTVVEMIREMRSGQLVPANEESGAPSLFTEQPGAA
ncbi:MAG: hypothetical protein KIT02_06150 [Devosia sp.]|uniref:hypothetical protein n=1 Tax=Devosia sp. TaxID=1871048 RepID=UPI0024CC1A3F|nr:hypothetical protein [Devosia sp.]UYO00787.1 MAG: hypothetical protein KIT02_06150 [Devosia sp.]